MSEDLPQQLVALLPRLRRFAYSLTGCKDDGDDIVQSACERALSRAHQWQSGTRLDSWMFRIIQTTWIDRLRAKRVRGESHDPDLVDTLVGEDGRSLTESRIMLASYVETAQQVAHMSEVEFFSEYGEAVRVLRHVDMNEDQAARAIVDLYQRHGKQVMGVIDDAIVTYRKEIRARTMPESCLLRLVHDPRPSSDAAPVDASISDADEAPDYQLVERGQGWVLRFDGIEKNDGIEADVVRFKNGNKPGKFLTRVDHDEGGTAAFEILADTIRLGFEVGAPRAGNHEYLTIVRYLLRIEQR